MLRSSAGRDQAQQVLRGIGRPPRRLRVQDVLAELVEGGLDPLRLEPLADAHRVLRALAGDEASREHDEGVHRFLRRPRAGAS